jgi:hypothetical protein
MTRPTEKVVEAAYRVMGYLVGTPHFKICYNTPAYPELRNMIQRTIAFSTTEAELDSFFSCFRSVL